MRRWIALAACLYPRAWRERYGEEFGALLEDAVADWRQLWNVTYGAFAMQLTNRMAYLKVAGLLAMAGGILALAASYRVPPRYVSSAVVRIVPAVSDNRPVAKEVLLGAAADRIRMLQGLGWGVLKDRAARQVVRWNPGDRNRKVLEVAEEHLDDVEIHPVAVAGERGFAVRVSFADADRGKAQAGLAELMTRAQTFNEEMNLQNIVLWKDLNQGSFPFNERFEVKDAASLPSAPSEPRRSIFLALGSAGGLLLGVTVILFRRHPGAGLRAAVFGSAGFAVAAGLSLLVPERYTATTEMSIGAPNDPEHLSGAVAVTPLSEWAERLKREVVTPGRFMVAGVDQEMSAKIMRVTRAGIIGIRAQGSETAAPFLEVTFSHLDKSTARLGAELVAAALATRYWNDLSADTPPTGVLREARQHRSGEVFRTDHPKPPTVTHYRWEMRAAGALLGILLSIVWRQRRTERRNGGDVIWVPA